MDIIQKLMSNWNRFTDANPDIIEAVKDGYEVAAYDEETEMIISIEKVGDTVKMRIIEDSHIIRKTA
jgi:hypothetical protein